MHCPLIFSLLALGALHGASRTSNGLGLGLKKINKTGGSEKEVGKSLTIISYLKKKGTPSPTP